MKQHHLSRTTKLAFIAVGLTALFFTGPKQAAPKELTPPGVFVGWVTGASGNPIAGTVIYWGLDHVYPEYHEKTTTDSWGYYWLQTNTADESQSHFTVTAEGYAPIWQDGVSPGTWQRPKEVNFTVEQGHWLEVKVVDKDGKPIPNVQVTPYFNRKYEDARLPGYQPLQTDKQGCVLLEDLPAASVRLNLTGNELTWITGYVTEVDKQITITMNPAMIIRGQVLDKESKFPITDFRVQLYGVVVPEELREGRWFSDPGGRFILTNLQVPITLELLIEAEGYPPIYVGEVEPQLPTKAKEKVYYLPPVRQIKGILLDEATGEPLLGLTITCALIRHAEFYTINWNQADASLLAETQIVTNKNGEFTFFEEEGDWPKGYVYSNKTHLKIRTLFIQAKGYEKLIIRPSDRDKYQTETGDLQISLAPGASISGLYSINGQPQNKEGIYLESAEQYFGWIWTDQEGRFHWDDLPAGTYTIRGPFTYRVTLEKSEHKNINLGEDMGACNLFGWAFKEGKPLVRATVTLYPAFEWQFREFYAQTNAEGQYRFEGLKPGKYKAYPGPRVYGDGSGPNIYGPETIEIYSETERDFDFQKRR